MTAPTLSREAERYARLTGLDRQVLAEMLGAWSTLDLDDIQFSFEFDVLPSMLVALTTGQRQAADIGADFMRAAAVDLDAEPGPEVDRGAFAGVASDGRSLPGLLTQPFVSLLQALAVGVQRPVAQKFASDQIDRITVTQLHDAAREAGQVGLVTTPEIKGYTRFVEPGACGRCVVIAGRFYRWNDGFDRHPKCRCGHRPTTKANPRVQDPRELFDDMTPAEQAKAFTVDGAQAIRDGADPSRVINARKGMSTVQTPSGRNIAARTNVLGQDVFTTRSLTRGRKAPPRLMPASIYELATDRADAVRLLRLHGYIT